MTRRSRLLPSSVLLLLAAACAEGPVRRVVPLVAEDGYPTASSAVVGPTLHLTVARLEAPAPEFRLFLWARAAGAWSAVGELATGSNTLTGPAWESVDELWLSLERDTLGSEPSSPMLFRGPVGEPLTFQGPGGPGFEALRHATLEAVLENETLTMHVDGLPSLAGGAFYGVWLHGAAHEGEELEMTSLGHLKGDDSTLRGDELLASHVEVVLTVELQQGADGEGSIVMRGTVFDPAAAPTSPAEAALTHQH